MNHNFIKFSIFIIGLSLFSSCQKESVNTNLTTQQLVYPKIKNGRLQFEDLEHFKNYMAAINEMPIEEVEDMNKNHGFKSLYASGKGAAEPILPLRTRGGFVADSYIPDDQFAAVLNESHQLQVSTSIYEANNSYSYMVLEGSEDNILDFETALSMGVVKPEDIPSDGQYYYENLYVYPTNLTLDIAEAQLVGNPDGLATRGLTPERKIVYSYFDNDWRLHAEAWKVNYLIYASIGVESKCNKVANFFSLWNYYVNKKINNLSLAYDGVQTKELSTQTCTSCPKQILVSTQPVSYSQSLPNVSSITNRLDWSTATIPFSNAKFGIASLKITGMKLTSRHSGNKDGRVRNITMDIEIKP